MSPELLDLLQCPEHRAPLKLEADRLVCGASGHAYPVTGGIPRIFDALDPAARDTVESFRFQWERFGDSAFDILDEEAERAYFLDFLGHPAEHWAGKLVLDAGCGPGWYSRMMARAGARVVSVDLSAAVDLAAGRSECGNPVQVQADLTRLPFRDGVFDLVFCYCVIQHTSDTRAALAHLVRVARPGAQVVLTHYGPIRYVRPFYDAARAVTTRMPLPLLYALSHAAIPMAHVPGLRHLCFPSNGPARPVRRRVLDTFDWYHPRHHRYATQAELESWCREAGLRDLEGGMRLGVGIRGMRT